MNAVGMNLLDEKENREASFCALHEREDEASFMLRTETHKLIVRFARKQDASTYTQSDIIGGEFYDLKTDDDIAALRAWFTEACLCDQ